MRRFLIVILCLLAVVPVASAKNSRIVKVLPQFLDQNGKNAVAPSLYERDAYQAHLREHPELRSGLGFFVQWKGKKHQQLLMRVEMRGVFGNVTKFRIVEEPVQKEGWFSTWTTVKFTGPDYKQFGDLIAWRVTLLEGDQVISEQKSFLW